MKLKLRIDDLRVASFSPDEEGSARERGTVRAASIETQPYESCVVAETCISPCGEVRTRDTCYDSCGPTCDDRTCNNTCLRDTC